MGWLKTLAFLAYALARPLMLIVRVTPGCRVVAVHQYQNERRLIRARLNGEYGSEITFVPGWEGALSFCSVLVADMNWGKAAQAVRVAARLVERRGILVGTRQAQFVLIYAYARHLFLARPGAWPLKGMSFFTSTESNPDVIGIALASQSLGARQIYVNHGFLDVHLGIFFHDSFWVQGKALWNRIAPHARIPTTGGEVRVLGPYFPARPLRVPVGLAKRVGVVCPLCPSADKLLPLLDRIVAEFPEAEVEVRLHPNDAFSRALRERLRALPRVRLSPPSDWRHVTLGWDLAFAGGTSAHLDLLCLGIPSLGVDMDDLPADRYGFHAGGLVPWVESLAGALPLLNAFYGSEEWRSALEAYLPARDSSFSVP